MKKKKDYITETEKNMIAATKLPRKYQGAASEDLFKDYQKTRDPEIMSELCLRNSALVSHTLCHLAFKEDDKEDLFQEGMIGLMEAIERYHPERGAFSTYALYWIRKEIGENIETVLRTVRRPSWVQAKSSKIQKFSEEFATRSGREPTAKELSEHIGLPEKTIHLFYMAAQGTASLNTKISKLHSHSLREETELIDLIEGNSPFSPPEEEACRLIEREEIAEQIKRKLDSREAFVIAMRYGMGPDHRIHTLKETGDILSVREERVRQIQNQALGKLRKALATA